MKIAIFYHCLFFFGDPPKLQPEALRIVTEQMNLAASSGLIAAADFFLCGINGGTESVEVAQQHIPSKAKLVYHGLESRSENLTIVEIEKWVPAHDDWAVLYFHTKGVTHSMTNPNSDYTRGTATPWRRSMMADLVANWRSCVRDLESGWEVVCSHFVRGVFGCQNYAPGTFFWARSSFLKEVPSIFLRDRIKQSGIASAESRWEAEVWIGNGRMPKVKEYRPNGGGGVP